MPPVRGAEFHCLVLSRDCTGWDFRFVGCTMRAILRRHETNETFGRSRVAIGKHAGPRIGNGSDLRLSGSFTAVRRAGGGSPFAGDRARPGEPPAARQASRPLDLDADLARDLRHLRRSGAWLDGPGAPGAPRRRQSYPALA